MAICNARKFFTCNKDMLADPDFKEFDEHLFDLSCDFVDALKKEFKELRKRKGKGVCKLHIWTDDKGATHCQAVFEYKYGWDWKSIILAAWVDETHPTSDGIGYTMRAHIQHEKVPITSEILVYDSSNFNASKRTRINKVLRDRFTPLNIRITDERFPILTAKDLANRKYQEFVHHELEKHPTFLCHLRSVSDNSPTTRYSSSPHPNPSSPSTTYTRTPNQARISRVTLATTRFFSNVHRSIRLIAVWKNCHRELNK